MATGGTICVNAINECGSSPPNFMKVTVDLGKESDIHDNASNCNTADEILFFCTYTAGDGDGYYSDEDCDDTNAAVNPGQMEVVYNGIDDDCDQATLDDDLDGDGFILSEDCDDENATINPSAEDIPNNGIDENCDGLDSLVNTNYHPTIQPQIYPNPTKGAITIRLLEQKGATIDIRDVFGKLLLKEKTSSSATVDLSPYPDGVYLLFVGNGYASLVRIGT